MRREDLYRAIGELDEKTLHSAEQGWSHSGVFRRALTAAACLILAVGIGSLFFLNRGGHTRSASETGQSELGSAAEQDVHAECRAEHIPCSDRILIGDIYYQSDYGLCAALPERTLYTDGTLWCYDPSVGETQVLADMAVLFTETQTGYYCTDVNTGDVYRIEGASLTHAATLPDYNSSEQTTAPVLVDLVGDDLYYLEFLEAGIAYCVMDIQSGNVRRLTEHDNDIWGGACRMWDGRIYYLKNGQEDPVVGRAPIHLWALDVFTGENQEVTPEGWPEDMYYMYQNAGWGNFWLFAVSHGLEGDSIYQLDLSDWSFAELGRIGEFDSQASVRQEGETVYWSSCFAAATGFCLTVTEYDMETKTAVEREDVIPIGFDDPVLCSFPCGIGCYYDETWESHTDTYYYDYAAGAAVCISPGQTKTDSATVQADDEQSFFDIFHEIDEGSMRSYLDAHPEALENGWGNIDINESIPADSETAGTGIQTVYGDEILAIDAPNGVLLIRTTVEGAFGSARATIAICKDTSRLSLCPAENLSGEGQTVGEICAQNGGIAAMTGSAFVDANGEGNGGTLSGLMICGENSYGTALGAPYKRLELRRDDKMYIVDSSAPVGEGTRDACEFMPAAIVDGVVIRDSEWDAVQPRAILGQTDRLETVMAVAEGRLTDSPGCSVEELAEVMRKYGCVQALNLDGGTSAILYYKGKPVTRCSNPSLPEGRTMPSAWVYKAA